MRKVTFIISILFLSAVCNCKKDTAGNEIIQIPNGDFELWDDMPNLLFWKTNSCPACDPPFETYIVQKSTDAYSGQFAAKLISNGVYRSFAENKFPIHMHPTNLTGYIKSTIATGDSAIIHIDLFSGKNIVDNGTLYEISSTGNYKKIEIQITQNSSFADSALIRIEGGIKQNTELFIDNLSLVKTPK